MDFSPTQLLQSLQQAPPSRDYRVALSGGLDSSVLLYALVQLQQQGSLGKPLSALHINHGLQAGAARWQAHCEAICSEWGVPLHCESVTVRSEGSQENAAREARYRVFRERTGPDTLLLQAHHLDDQMETFLLRLMRGAGPAGLAAIPRQRTLGGESSACLFRPLLEVPRSQLLDYALRAGLGWQEDASNRDQRHDRNYLRHTVLPLIEARWPGYRSSWSKSLALLSDASSLSQELAAADLARLETPRGSLNLSELRQLAEARQKNLLRYWFASLGLEEPGWDFLLSLQRDLVDKAHSEGALAIQDCRLRVFDDELYLLEGKSTPTPLPGELLTPVDGQSMDLPENGRLQISYSGAGGLRQGLGSLRIRYRSGGEQLQLADRPRKSLKSLFQEMGIPPWLRDRVPLLYQQETLVCVPGIGIAEEALAPAGEPALAVHWESPQLTRRRPDFCDS